MNYTHLIDPFWQTIYTILTVLIITCLCIVIAIFHYHHEKPYIHYVYKKVTLIQYLFTDRYCPSWLNKVYIISFTSLGTAFIMFIVGELIN